MSNKSTIKCPDDGREFEATDAFRDEVQRELKCEAKELSNTLEQGRK